MMSPTRRRVAKTIGLLTAASAMSFWAGRRSASATGCYVQLGTSITAGTGTKYGGQAPQIVGDELGMIAVNGACPGSCAGQHKFPAFDPVSLYSLADAIVSGDWSAQSGRSGEIIRDRAISHLMTTGFDTVTHFGLEYGTNDFRYDRPIGDDSETCKETFKGALNHAVRALLKAYPTARVFLITPWWMPTYGDQDSDIYPNELGFFLKDYVEAMFACAHLNRVPCLDLWTDAGVNKQNYRDFTLDGVHPNDAGVFRRADLIAAFIRRIV